MEECGRRSICSVTFLVPLELDCHREDDVICQSLHNREEGGEEEEEHQDNELQVDDVNDATNATYSSVVVASEARDQGSPAIADARERGNPYDVSHHEPTPHHTPGSSVESCPDSSTTERW